MISLLRKMKFASKKNTVKPFFNPQGTQGTQPQTGKKGQQINFAQQIPAFQMPMNYFIPQPMGQVPQPQLAMPAKPAQAQQAKGQRWGTIKELIADKAGFAAQAESFRMGVLKGFLMTKLQSHPGLLDM